MNSKVTKQAWLKVGNDINIEEWSGLEPDENGLCALLDENEDFAVFRIRGIDDGSKEAITGILSFPTSSNVQPGQTAWTKDGDDFVSPAFGKEYGFRIEVANTASVSPVPRGGGHFRVVEEGGGG